MSDDDAKPDKPAFQLLYASMVTPPPLMRLEPAMRDILIVSHRRNLEDGITGLLLSDGRTFLQVLEGDEEPVERCYARIEEDVRNYGQTVRLRQTVPRRAFSRWSMCGLTLSAYDDALMWRRDRAPDVFIAPSYWLLQMLESVATRHGDELDAIHAELGAQPR